MNVPAQAQTPVTDVLHRMNNLFLIRQSMENTVVSQTLSALDRILEIINHVPFVSEATCSHQGAGAQKFRMRVHDVLKDANVKMERRAVLHSKIMSLLPEIDRAQTSENGLVRMSRSQAITLLSECFQGTINLEQECLSLIHEAQDIQGHIERD